jgi:hypothetical protein
MQFKYARKLHSGDQVYVRKLGNNFNHPMLGKVIKVWDNPSDPKMILLDVLILDVAAGYAGEIFHLNHRDIH